MTYSWQALPDNSGEAGKWGIREELLVMNVGSWDSYLLASSRLQSGGFWEGTETCRYHCVPSGGGEALWHGGNKALPDPPSHYWHCLCVFRYGSCRTAAQPNKETGRSLAVPSSSLPCTCSDLRSPSGLFILCLSLACVSLLLPALSLQSNDGGRQEFAHKGAYMYNTCTKLQQTSTLNEQT